MCFKIAILEFRRNLKNVSTYIFAFVLFIFTYLFASNLDPNSSVAWLFLGKEWHNAPILIAELMARMSVLGLLFTVVMVGRAAARDFEVDMHHFIFSTPVSKSAYLGGRFLGSLAANIMIYIAMPLGFLAGCAVIGPEYSGPFRMMAYLLPTLFILIPNLFLLGSVFFAMATLTRKMVMTYVTAVTFLMVYGLIQAGLYGMENDNLKMLIDPFGITFLDTLTQYWTVAEMNQFLMPMSLPVIINRLIWIFPAVTVFILTVRRFKMVSHLESKKGKDSKPGFLPLSSIQSIEKLKIVRIDSSFFSQIQKCFRMIVVEFRRIVFHPAFLVLTFLSMAGIVSNFILNVGGPLSSKVYPLTSWYMDQTYQIWAYMIPLAIFFGGVIIWRERNIKSHELFDTLPVPDWMSFTSKLGAIFTVQFFYILLAVVCGVVTQIVGYGFNHIEWKLYIIHFFGIILLRFWLLTVIIFFIQNLVKNKYLGFFISTLYVVADLIIYDIIRFEGAIFRYGHMPPYIYSNINGYGHFAPTLIIYAVYWILLGGIIAGVTSLLWRRDNETALKIRYRRAMGKMNRKMTWVFSGLFVFFLLTGLFIGYNTYLLNPYQTRNSQTRMSVDYEKKYHQYHEIPMPNITHIELEVDIFPEPRDVHICGHYVLTNLTSTPITDVIVHLSDYKITTIHDLSFSQPAYLIEQGPEFGFRLFRLQKPLLPKGSVDLRFDVEVRTPGFSPINLKNEIASNGTSLICSPFQKPYYFPTVGFQESYCLDNERKRLKFGLPPKSMLPAIVDADRSPSRAMNNVVTYNGVISTSPNQVIISNGDIVRQWTENGRRKFHYRSDIQMPDEIVIVSGEYQTKHATRNGKTVEVYYHPSHAYNIDRMINGLQHSINYGQKAFNPYVYEKVRLAEIPDYFRAGARDACSAVIWKESAGFISRIEKNDVDMVFFIAAHEMGHNWWPGSILAADAEGIDLLSEAIAQYIATMCLQHRYGLPMTRKMLAKEMDSYLKGRKLDMRGERPLVRSQISGYYLGYAKTNLAMYALQDYIGEDRVNQALGHIVNQYGFDAETTAVATDLIQAYRDVTPDSLQYLITDLFESIILYENKAVKAEASPMADGRYQVSLWVESHKFEADSSGYQKEVDLADYIPIGILGENDETLYLKKMKTLKTNKRIDIVVDGKPVKAGIDPFGLLIDRDQENNTVAVRFID